MKPAGVARILPVGMAIAAVFVLASWTHGFQAFTSFSAARVAAGPLPRPAPPLLVVDARGTRYDLAAPGPAFRLVQAMYLRCPDVCPIAMANLGQVQYALRDLSPGRVEVVSLSIDGDSPRDLLDRWRAHGSPEGWTMASLEATDGANAMERLGIWVYRRRDGLINHSTDMVLIDRAGRVVRVFRADGDPGVIAAEIRRLAS